MSRIKLCLVLVVVLLMGIDQAVGSRPLSRSLAGNDITARQNRKKKPRPAPTPTPTQTPTPTETPTPTPTTTPIPTPTSTPTPTPTPTTTPTPTPTPTPTATPTPTPTSAPTTHSAKKGVGAWYTKTVQANLADLGISWYYTWRPTTANAGFSAPAGIEHVPMIWGTTEATATTVAQAKAEPSPTLLGFNEPDKSDQSNMSVPQAISLWPLLQSTGKRLGSPATSNNPALTGSWQESFMKEVAAKGYKVDFMAVHYYAENMARWDTTTAVADMKAFLDAIYAKYQKPIWVTEWALTHWWPFPITYPSFEIQAAFAKAASQMMDSLPYVERYAFFALPSYTTGSTSYLYTTDGSITPTGTAYKSV